MLWEVTPHIWTLPGYLAHIRGTQILTKWLNSLKILDTSVQFRVISGKTSCTSKLPFHSFFQTTLLQADNKVLIERCHYLLYFNHMGVLSEPDKSLRNQTVIFEEKLLNLSGWYRLIELYRFQAYTSVIYHLYIVLCVHHPMSSLLPSSFIPLYILLPPLPSFPPVITILLSASMS